MSAEKERDLILGWLERNHPEVLSELVDACRGVLQRREAARLDPGLIRRRTRNGKHLVTLRRLTPLETDTDPAFRFMAVACEPPCSDIVPESVEAKFTAEFSYYVLTAASDYDLTEPA